jgi:acyl-CoA thioesterase I
MRDRRTDVGNGATWRAGARRTAAAGLALAALLAGCDGSAGETPDGAPNNTTGAAAMVSPAESLAVPAKEDAGGGGPAAAAGAPRVLVAGTSLTAGLGLDPSDAYPALLQRKADSAGYGVRVVNAGLSGETSAGLARRIDWLLQEPAAVVVIETGANDGLRGMNVDSLGANLRRILGTVRARLPEATVLVVQMEAPPNFGPAYTRAFRETFATVAREHEATLVPFLLEGVAGVRELNQDDAIHPNEEGARRVAATVWRVLGPVLASLDRTAAAG